MLKCDFVSTVWPCVEIACVNLEPRLRFKTPERDILPVIHLFRVCGSHERDGYLPKVRFFAPYLPVHSKIGVSFKVGATPGRLSPYDFARPSEARRAETKRDERDIRFKCLVACVMRHRTRDAD